MKDFGIYDEELVTKTGPNAKMNEFCAAMGLCNLRHIDDEIAKRKKITERYRERLGDAEGIRLSPIQQDVVSNYAYFPVVFDEKLFGAGRDEVKDRLAQEKIGARKYFYPLTSQAICYKDRFDIGKTPIADQVSQRVLTLPLYADLTLEETDRICDLILQCRKVVVKY